MQNETIRLIDCTPDILEVLLKGQAYLRKYLKVEISPSWSNFGMEVFEYAFAQIRTKPDAQGWWSYLIVHKVTNTLIGTCGYKGPPNENGQVEIGYEIAPAYRKKGLATMVAGLLIEHAFQQNNVSRILAHTLPERNASCQVLERNGFRKTDVVEDPEDGTIWRWELSG